MNQPEKLSLEMDIPSLLSELERVVSEAETFFAKCCATEDQAYTAVLLTSEAVTNAIEHGNQLDAAKRVRIEFKATPKTVELWVEDEGTGFDPKKVEDPTLSDNLLEDGGRGIFLIEHLSDEVKYEKGGRRLGMLFYRNRKA